MPLRAGFATLLALIMVLAGCGRAVPATLADPTLVATTSGPVRGVAADGFRLFQGIPYAAAPKGPLRWRPPQAPVPWTVARDATKPGLRCIQDIRQDPDYGRPISEDCLNLTVWTPTGATPESPRPVMVWIHGGGFLNGSSDIYGARTLTTAGDIVVVTVNYRLGALGFLAHPTLADDPGGPGNYGLADQQAALRWVRDNITAFGGDPEKVTIAGESAGAISVCDHLVAPESAGLFRAAIMQSGPCQAQADLPTAERVSVGYARQVGCGDSERTADCLRQLPPARLTGGPQYVRLGSNILTGPITGTPRLPAPPLTAAGNAARVPVLIGSTADEFTLFVAMLYLRRHSLPPYRRLLADTFGAEAPLVAAQYPVQRYDGSTALAYAAAVTDGVFACPVDAMATELARRGQPVYAFEFADRTAPAPDPLRTLPFSVGAGHALELRYLFEIGGAPRLNPAQQELSDAMIAYWSRFVTTGAPDAPGRPEWPALDPQHPQRLTLQTGQPVVTGDFAQLHRCGFWAARG